MSMEQPLVHAVLLRKELKQLAPLVIALFSLCFIGMIGFMSLPSAAQHDLFSPGWWLIAVPVLCAVGTGPMLIGQEKETRTLQWLSSLPLSKPILINTKLLAGLIVLGICWLFVLAVYGCFDHLGSLSLFNELTQNDEHPIRSRWLLFWLFSSFYLLMIGYVTAWKCSNAMNGLIALVPLAMAPSLLRFGWEYFRNPGLPWGSASYDSSFTAHMFWLLASLLPAILFTGRFAMQALAPQEYQVSKPNPYAIERKSRSRVIQPVMSPHTALLWQFYHQNKRIYLSLFGVTVTLSLLLIYIENGRPNGISANMRPWVTIVSCLAASWMGVLVFQSDNLQERIRFLADRGVSPWKAWLIRMAWPLMFISTMVWLYALDWEVQSDRGVHVENPSAHFAAALLLLFFLYGQWFAQLVKQPLLSALGAPVVAILALIFCFFAMNTMGTTFLALAPMLLMPLAATAWSMRSWMDRHTGWKYFAKHAGVICLGLLVPTAILFWRVAQVPGMDDSMRQHFDQVNLAQVNTSFPHWVALLPDPPPTDSIASFSDSGSPSAQAVTPYPSIEKQLAAVEDSLSTISAGIQVQKNHLASAWGELELAWLALTQHPEDAEKLKNYRLELTRLVLVCERLRRTARLLEQDQADGIEIVLIRHMSSPDSQERFGDELWRRCVKTVSDRQHRHNMRMQALIASWAEVQKRNPEQRFGGNFGGYLWFLPWEGRLIDTLVQDKRVDHISGLLMQLLIEGPTTDEATRVSWLKEIARTVSDREVSIGRINDPDSFQASMLLSNANMMLVNADLPGKQWLAGWEAVGAAFAISDHPEAQP